MKNRLLLGLCLIFNCCILKAQEIVSVEYLSNVSKAEIAAEVPAVALLLQNGIEQYKVVYTTIGLDGEPTEVSGLLVIPDIHNKRYPLLCYQHGTSNSPVDVPSNPANANALLSRIYSGLGYVVCAPDLLGLGVHEGVHNYVHAASEAWVAADMLRAVKDYGEDNQIFINDQLFLTGYSQGGHSSMALHKAIDQMWSDEFTVTAAAHQSGPYSISGVMRDLIVDGVEYFFPAYIPNTMMSYEAAYGTVYDELADVIRPAYLEKVEEFANGEIGLFDLNSYLIDNLTINEGASIPKFIFKEDIVEAVTNDLDHPINIALADNNTYDWTPTAPTRMMYCNGDEQVPFENAIVAEAKMIENGATDAIAQDVDEGQDLNHNDCVEPAVTQTIFLFFSLQEIDEVNSTRFVNEALPFEVFPNPVEDRLTIKDLEKDAIFQLLNQEGRIMLERKIQAGDQFVDVSTLPAGLYLLQVVDDEAVWQKKIFVH